MKIQELADILSKAGAPDAYSDSLANLLEQCEDDCREAADECETSWQSKEAGKPWRERAALLRRFSRTVRERRDY